MLDMTAQPTRQHDEGSEVDARISATVEGIRVYRRMPKTSVYQAMHVSRTAYYDRLSGVTRWTAADVKRAADALGVSVATLYDGLLPTQRPAPPGDGLTIRSRRHGMHLVSPGIPRNTQMDMDKAS